jgi:hypothetical protein
MTHPIDRAGIAARIRDLIGPQDGGDPAASARRLGVDEVAFRISIDDLSPYPTVDVIAAMVATYGVDPSWLLTGECDPGTHRNLLEDQRQIEHTITRLMQPLMRPSGGTIRQLGTD